MPRPFSAHRVPPLLFLAIFIDIMGFGILIPIIPILLADPASRFFLLPPGTPLAHGYILLGGLMAAFSFMQFLAAPVLGQLSDRFGRRRILALSLAGTSVSYFLFAVGIVRKDIPLLFFSRALDGATGGVIAVAQASIADITTAENRVGRFALLAAAFGLGFIGGPFLGGKLSDPGLVSWFNATTPFWFAGLLALANTLSVWFWLPETLPVRRHGTAVRWSQAWINIGRAFTHPTLRSLFITLFLFQTGFAFYATFAGVFMIHRFGFSQGGIGDYFACMGAVGLLTQWVIVRWAARRWTPAAILRVSLGLAGLFILLASFTTRAWAFVAVMPFFALAMNLTQTNSTGLISISAEETVQGEILGINSSLQALAMGIPPLISGFLAAAFAPATPLQVAAVMIFAAAAVFRWCCRRAAAPAGS